MWGVSGRDRLETVSLLPQVAEGTGIGPAQHSSRGDELWPRINHCPMGVVLPHGAGTWCCFTPRATAAGNKVQHALATASAMHTDWMGHVPPKPPLGCAQRRKPPPHPPRTSHLGSDCPNIWPRQGPIHLSPCPCLCPTSSLNVRPQSAPPSPFPFRVD